MSVDIHPASHRDPVATQPVPGRRPVALVIAASLAVGAVTALLLALAVFAGGTESAITGSLLTAFGLGWALIAVLTSRLTSQPQRWTALPAAAMGATGVTLLVLRPQDDAMTLMAWVWPPAVLALCVWMHVSMRRSLSGRGRWLLVPVISVLVLASVGATFENLALRSDRDTHPAPGKTYDVGGRRMHLDCHGRGGPTVVLSNGLGEVSASWARITGPVSRTTRVCAYDRAGQGWSDDAKSPQDGVTAARDLHTLLATAGEHGPYVLVGHSTGGTYAMTYAAQYPEQVAGMVLLDSSSPEQFTRMPAYPGQYSVMRRGLALLPTLNRLGLSRLLAPASPLPAPAAQQVTAVTSSARAARNGRDEISAIPKVFEQAQALTTLGGRPLAVLTASENLTTVGWYGAQKQLAALSTNHVHRTVHATHEGVVDDESASVESVRAISEVISSVRTGSHLDPK